MVPYKVYESVVELLPKHYTGRWRMIVELTFAKNGKEMQECRMGFGDVFID